MRLRAALPAAPTTIAFVPGFEDRLVVTCRSRGPDRLGWGALADLPDPPLVDLVAAAPAGRALVLTGGEPTLRPDLPDIVGALAGSSAVLATDGLALGSPGTAKLLARRGLAGVRVSLHSARGDAHDWIARRPGAARAAVRAMRACSSAGLQVEGAITATRPTMPLLPETVAVLARIGVGRVRVRRWTGPAGDEDVALAPRMAMVAPWLELAAHRARELGIEMVLEDFPLCRTGAVRGIVAGPVSVRWHVARLPGWTDLGERLAAATARARCGACPGPADCSGLDEAYVDCFGSSELDGHPGGPA